jgi:hypothetical protein
MIPDDDRLSHAMHGLEPQTTRELQAIDVPDLFERVAAGVRRRRRRMASGTAAAGAAAVVAVIAVIPAIHGSSHAVSTAGPAPASTYPSESGIAGPVSASSALTSQPAPASGRTGPAQPVSPAPSPLPTDAKGCPLIPSLQPGADAVAQAKAAALAAVAKRYGAAAAVKAKVTSVYAAATGEHYGIVADAICGKTLGDNSYVVELGFGGSSASIGSGQLFVANFPGGWQVWFQYH